MAFSLAGAVVAGVLAFLTFPEKVEKALEIGTRTVARMQRPLIAWSFTVDSLRDSKATDLARSMYPGKPICLVRAQMADLTGDSSLADLVVEFAEQSGTEPSGCGGETNRPIVAVFTTPKLSPRFAFAGNVDDQGLRVTWEVKDRFLFVQPYGVDSPSIVPCYLYDFRLRCGAEQIPLTDASEHEYEPHSAKIEGGVLLWGLPEGLTYLVVGSDGKLIKGSGLPPDLRRPNATAVEIRWDGTEFADAANLDLSEQMNHVVRVGAMAHLYLAGCEAQNGFQASPLVPGALVPAFEKKPTIRCGTRTEGEYEEFEVGRM